MKICETFQNQNSEPLKLSKGHLLYVIDTSKLILRKIKLILKGYFLYCIFDSLKMGKVAIFTYGEFDIV